MKNILVGFTLTLIMLTSAQAQRRDRDGDRSRTTIDFGRVVLDLDFNSPRACRSKVQELVTSNRSLKNTNSILAENLRKCEGKLNSRVSMRGAVNQLTTENNNLRVRVQNQALRIRELEQEVEALRYVEVPTPIFDLAASMRACGEIDTSSYARECVQFVRKYSVPAKIVGQCARMSNTYYAKECVLAAGKFQTRPKAVKACVQINTSSYAVECVQYAGRAKASGDIVEACISTTTNSFYQKKCVEDLL